jgi:outer membrane protein assembly factor BamB
MPAATIAYLGIKGSVIALEVATGRRLWVRPLKGQGFVSVVVEGDYVLAATHGEVFCLATDTGDLLWHDPLKGFGYGLVSLATSNSGGQSPAPAAEERQRQAAAAAAAASAT